jgi:hypothetical protein
MSNNSPTCPFGRLNRCRGLPISQFQELRPGHVFFVPPSSSFLGLSQPKRVLQVASKLNAEKHYTPAAWCFAESPTWILSIEGFDKLVSLLCRIRLLLAMQRSQVGFVEPKQVSRRTDQRCPFLMGTDQVWSAGERGTLWICSLTCGGGERPIKD